MNQKRNLNRIEGSLLVTNSIALEAVAILMKKRGGEIEDSFPSFFVDRIKEWIKDREKKEEEIKNWDLLTSILHKEGEDHGIENLQDYIGSLGVKPFDEGEKVLGEKPFDEELRLTNVKFLDENSGLLGVKPLGRGGIFNALWDLCQEQGTGCRVLLDAIPIRQETVEICELFGLNPYYAASSGSLLLACQRGNELAWTLGQQGLPVSIIGVLTPGPSRTILSGEHGEHVRCLDRPQREELEKVGL